eukprot:scaffold152346_cov69-Cyclotella_meneghiniana.AAC.1
MVGVVCILVLDVHEAMRGDRRCVLAVGCWDSQKIWRDLRRDDEECSLTFSKKAKRKHGTTKTSSAAFDNRHYVEEEEAGTSEESQTSERDPRQFKQYLKQLRSLSLVDRHRNWSQDDIDAANKLAGEYEFKTNLLATKQMDQYE